MSDTKQTKTIGEHHVAAQLARHGWAPALTRDGLERTDILAVAVGESGGRQIQIQVKTATGSDLDRLTWLVGKKAFEPSRSPNEYFVLVAVPHDLSQAPRNFVMPRGHLAAAAWIRHMDWLTDPSVTPGKRNTPIGLARVSPSELANYEDRWDLLHIDEPEIPVLLPKHYRDLALTDRVGLPPEHPWLDRMPSW